MAVRIQNKHKSNGKIDTLVSPEHTKNAVPVKVVKQTDGPVTPLQKLTGYYKGLITALGTLLIILNEVTPVLNFLPGQDKQYVTIAIAVITTAVAILKENEHWVDELV